MEAGLGEEGGQGGNFKGPSPWPEGVLPVSSHALPSASVLPQFPLLIRIRSLMTHFPPNYLCRDPQIQTPSEILGLGRQRMNGEEQFIP